MQSRGCVRVVRGSRFRNEWDLKQTARIWAVALQPVTFHGGLEAAFRLPLMLQSAEAFPKP